MPFPLSQYAHNREQLFILKQAEHTKTWAREEKLTLSTNAMKNLYRLYKLIIDLIS